MIESNILLNKESVFVGIDVHKYEHTAVALDAFGQEKSKLVFTNNNLNEYINWLLSLGSKQKLIIGLEDVNSYGIHIVEALRQQSFHIRYVPAILTERERKASTKRHKSDSVDAKRVGKVILSKYEETLPAKESIADERELKTAQELNFLLMERRDLVRLKTILKNQLHALMHQYYGDNYQQGFLKAFSKKAISFYQKDILVPKENKEILCQSIGRRLQRLIIIENHIVGISKEIGAIGSQSKECLNLADSICGCGMITACAIMTEAMTIKRFNSKHNFSMYAGVAPIEHSSGRKNKLHTNPFGNRRLNKALHTIALSQIAIKGDNEGKIYYQKKLKEGKTKLWALRCLKHQIAKRVFTILKASLFLKPNTRLEESMS